MSLAGPVARLTWNPVDNANTSKNAVFLQKAELDVAPLAGCWPRYEARALAEERYDVSTGPNIDRTLYNSDKLELTAEGKDKLETWNVRSMTFRVCP